MKRVESTFIEAEGVRIHTRSVPCPEADATPVVVLHGFTGSTEAMRGVVSELCATRATVSIDLVGHGCSDAPDDVAQYSMERCVAQVAEVIDSLALGRPHLLGYSMGGRAALTFCTCYPERARSALLVGASAGLADPEARRVRIADDEALADHLVEVGLATFVEEWMAKALFASQARLGETALARARAERLRNRPQGLALSLRGMGTGAMAPLDLTGLKVPSCFVAGAEDEKFIALARGYAERLERACVEIIPEAGHAAHLENPEAFGRAAREFFARVDASSI
ncbi:MAG: 2-succinyl-6-hydroxy-2,4-cyclohexadiene-1-carboxylate synthase [bacterium]|nr:2-succinyl-6-hydroxy-2,4-cyclohexadiene-1-carboxylate synthase [bacterium]